MFARHKGHPRAPDIREGMTVFTADGYRLGQVIEVEEGAFAVERSALFPKGWRARPDEVKELKGREIYLCQPRETLQRMLWAKRREEGVLKLQSERSRATGLPDASTRHDAHRH